MDAIKEYFRIADKFEHEEITLQEYEEQCQALRDVQEVVHGQWIEIESNKFPYNNYVGCSVCKEEAKKIVVGGKLYLDKWYDEYDYFKSEYCPHCGARMDGER